MSFRRTAYLAVRSSGDATAGREIFRNQARRQVDVMKSKFLADFSEIRNADVALVGGKAAFLGELFCLLRSKGAVGFSRVCRVACDLGN
jgi:hypothetical protein